MLFKLLSLAACLPFAAASPCAKPSSASGTPRVLLPQGTVDGFRDSHNNSVFLGIPFAQSTGGQNRWKRPQDLPLPQGNKSADVFHATSYGPTCPQAITGTSYSRQDEDCLNLNVWAPSEGAKLPVFVYMYGGAMVTGSSSNPQFQGNNFARNGVIFVSFNTRESIWASPNSAELGGDGKSQNFSILDVEKALDWIHQNIVSFGGDPDHIVFGGHSSGSVHVDHYLWNHPDTWLKGAVQMSANAVSGPAYAPSNAALDVVAAEVGCGTGPGQLECLRAVDALAMQTAFFNATAHTWFTPVIDDVTRFADYPARLAAGAYASHVPLLTGNSAGEGTIFSLVYAAENADFADWIATFDADSAHVPAAALRAAYDTADFATESLRSGAQYGDARFNCPVDYFVDLRGAAQATWEYRFYGAYDNVVGVPGTAPTHGTEIPFFLGGNECFASLQGVTAAQQALADAIHAWFVAWIKDPAAGPGWEQVKPGGDGALVKLGVPGDELARVPGSASGHNARCQAVYKPLFPEYPVVQNPVRKSS
ncbi:hypothetical protein PG996_012500 [Apiospora saccharicola]|uniref:Carboxylesterase type B domain-containing protein n=1 Tax=Apiospora saccharicola TaxID=335842 RepID=A0ABR1U2S7_9PEZI